MDRVNDGERDAAIKAVEEALTSGRIVQADRDRRVDQLRTAQTPAEVQMIIHDLPYRDPGEEAAEATWATYQAPPAPAPTAGATSSEPTSPAVHVPYGPSAGTASTPDVAAVLAAAKTGNLKWLVLVPVVFAIFVVGGVVVSIVNAAKDVNEGLDGVFGDSTGSTYTQEQPKPQLFTTDGWDTMVSALEDTTGSTEAFSAVIYPEYAVIDAPAEPTGLRQISYYYGGELQESTKGTSTYARFDLATIDPAVLKKLALRARNNLVEDPTSYYVIVRKPGPPFNDGAWLSAYASNEFGESGFLQADKDGNVIRRYVSGE